MLKLYLLGPPRVEIDAVPVDIQRRRALALLAYLAVNTQTHSRDSLATLLFPDADQRRARAYLRRDLAALNTSLPGDWFVADRDTVTLETGDGIWVDVEQFRRFLAVCQAHDHPPGEPCPDCLALLTKAATLYTDHFLAGFTLNDSPEYDDWQFFQGESLRQEYALVLERLVKGLTAAGDVEAAIPHARQWVALDPLHEPAQQQLMRAYAQSGQQAAALRQYEEFSKLLEEELGIPPEEETATLYEAIKAKRLVGAFLKQKIEPPKNQKPVDEPAQPAVNLEQAPFFGAIPLPSLLGRYELLNKIGQGGFATVYQARDRELDRLVALKALSTHLLVDTEWIKRFRREAQLIAHLDHPHVVPIYDVGQAEGRHYIVMRLVNGPSLAGRLTEQGPFTWSEALTLMTAVAKGLDYAHRRAILHRDLKPANILLDPERGPLLSDFGLAKLAGSNSMSRTNEVVGTPFYIAPEIWDGQPATPQTDIYALGCILFEIITGQKLFFGDTPPSVMRAHFEPLRLPSRWPKDTPADLADVLNVALAKDPHRRYGSAAELLTALADLVEAKQTPSPSLSDSSIVALATQQRQAGQYQTAIEMLAPILMNAPTDESLQREMMRLYALAGQRHEALRQYQDCVAALALELKTMPGPETQQLYQQILNDEIAPPVTIAPKATGTPPAPISIEVERSAPLVGRQAELDQIRKAIMGSWTEQGCTLLLAGVSGVGKTRLAYEALRAVAEAGGITMVGAAYEQEGHLAYHPFIEAIDRYLSEQQRPLDQNPITHYKPMGLTDPQQENSALFKATNLFLTRLADNQPVVLLVDDLHAADEASLSMFHYLARQTRSAPIVLLATYRTDISTNGVSPFGSLLNALYREQLSQVVQLQSLSAEAAAKIIEHTLAGEAAPALVQAICEIAEGNPFYVQQITQAMQREGRLLYHQERWRLPPGSTLQVPSELRDLLRERVQRLGATVETALTSAAVVGREFRFNVLRIITDLPDGDLFDALDTALAAHLLEETETGYRFQHSLIRRSLYDTLSRRRRAWLHTRTAEAIETTYAHRPGGITLHVEALAFHYDLSDRREKALPYFLQAADKAIELFALEIGHTYLERALNLMAELGVNDPARLWPILEKAGNLGKVLADTTQAVAHYEQALALPSTTTWQLKSVDRIRLQRSLARTFMAAGRLSEVEQHLQEAMEIVVDTIPASRDYANLLYDVSLWHWHKDEHQAAFDMAQRSLQVAEQLDDVKTRAQAYEMLALACHSLGEWQQGLTFEQQRSTLVGPNLDVTEAFDAHL
ncbi:MAG: protein kinase [Anaerolineae bacterium]|nr:protein kinase [Anaerolineae bacterium]